MRVIQDRGVQPPRLLRIDLPEGTAKTTMVRDLRALLSLDTEPLGVDTVQITEPHESVSMILSAVQHSPSVKTVDIGFHEGLQRLSYGEDWDEELERRGAWRWIAYTLLSSHAAHKIEELRLDFDEFGKEDLQAIRDVLASEHTLADLIEGGADRNAGRLSARRFYLSRPLHHQNSAVDNDQVVTTERPTVVQIVKAPVDSEGQWWQVWFPGHGMALVHATDIMDQLPASTVTSDAPVFPRVQMLKGPRERWDSEEQKDTTWCLELELLQFVSHETQELTLVDYFDDTEWCSLTTRALAVCPRLKTLNLQGIGMLGLQEIVDCAVAGHAKLERLVVDSIHVDYREKIVSFFQALEDPTHPLTDHLREIELTFKGRTYRKVNLVWRAALAMLEKNVSLRVVNLTVLVGDPPFQVEDDMAFSDFGQMEEYPPVVPQPLTSKLAFLSVAAGHKQCRVAAVKLLDTLALSRIFQFAGSFVNRRVSLMCKGPGPSVEFDLGSDDEWEQEHEPDSDGDWEQEQEQEQGEESEGGEEDEEDEESDNDEEEGNPTETESENI